MYEVLSVISVYHYVLKLRKLATRLTLSVCIVYSKPEDFFCPDVHQITRKHN